MVALPRPEHKYILALRAKREGMPVWRVGFVLGVRIAVDNERSVYV